MGVVLLHNLRTKGQMSSAALARDMAWGSIGGLVGLIVMDLVLAGMSLAVGLPTVIFFSTIGDTAAGFFALLGIPLAGVFPLGTAVHNLSSMVLGAIFGAAAAQIDALRVDTLKKGIVLAVLYIEILSQPILATSPILLKMTTAQTLQWYGVSADMHLIWAVVLGVVVSYGLHLPPAARHA